MTPALSVIVVTSGRPLLTRALRSIQAQPLAPQDEVLVVGAGDFVRAQAAAFGYRFIPDGPFGCWGQRERQNAMRHATGTHLVFMDDDDFYLEGAFEAIRAALTAHPARPILFRMHEMHGLVLWRRRSLECGNVSGTQFVTPNDPAKLGVWGLSHEGDFDFIVSTLAQYPPRALVWAPAIIVGCRTQGVPAGSAVPA